MLINSKRRFKALTIDGFYQESTAMNDCEISERFMKVVEHFGCHIKQLTVKYVHVSNVMKILNLLPNLEKIFLNRISDFKFVNNRTCDNNKNLYKLKEIKSSFCNASVMNIFKILPAGVLRKIDMTLHDFINTSTDDHEVKLFENQQNVIEVETTERIAKTMNFENMKLKELKLWGENDLSRILNNQNKIKKLELGSIKTGDFKIIYRNLTSLQDLKVGHAENISSHEFTELFKLKKLRKLSLEFDEIVQDELNFSLSVANCENLIEMSLEFLSPGVSITESTFAQLGKNLPQLKTLNVNSESPLNSLNVIFQHMQSLKFLHFAKSGRAPSDHFIFQDGLINEKLIELQLSGNSCDNIEDLPKLIGCCKRLKILCLDIGQPEASFFNSLKEHGKNLEHFECTCLNRAGFKEMIYQQFDDQFNKFDFSDIFPHYGKISLMMSK